MRILLSGTAALALFAPTAAFAGPPSWSFSESSGQVVVMSPGVSRVAHRNEALKVGDTVATGPNGRAIVVRGQEYLIVAPNSRFRIADPAKSGGLTQIVEQSGNIVFRIKKMTTPHFGVQTPYLAAVVKGTTFSVTVNERGATVQVLEGRVEVATRDGGAAYMVLPGDIGAVSATARQTLDVKGRETRSIVSPLPPEALPAASDEKTEPTPALWSDTPAEGMEGTIVASIGEGPVRLDALSDGLVRGDSSLNAVVATTTVTARAAAPTAIVPVPATGASPAVVPVEVAVLPLAVPPVVAAPPVVLPAVATIPAGAPTAAPPAVTELPPVIAPPVSTPPVVVEVVVPPVVTPPVVVAVVAPPVVVAVVVPPVVPVVGGGGNGNNGNGNDGNGNGNGNGNGGGNGNGNNGNGNGNGGGNGSNGGGNGNGNNGNGRGNGGGNGSNGGGNGNGNNGNGNGNGGNRRN